MDIYTLLHTVKEALFQDQDLDAWCNLYYGRSLHLYIGADERNPPPEAHYPVVHLFPVRKSAGRIDDLERDHSIGITCGIIDTNQEATHDARIIEYTGIKRIAELVALLTVTMKGVALVGGYLRRVDTDFEPVEHYPAFLAVNKYEYTVHTAFRDDPFA